MVTVFLLQGLGGFQTRPYSIAIYFRSNDRDGAAELDD